MRQRTKRPVRLRTKLVLALFGLALGVCVGEVLLRLITVREPDGKLRIGRSLLAPFEFQTREEARAALEADETYMVPDSRLGWTLRPNGRDRKLGLYATNSFGLRSLPREALPAPAAGVVRVLAVGDSFTHSDQVPYEDSWTHLLERELGSGFEVLNGGVPGYGTDQALLRWRELGPKLTPRIAIFGVILEDAFRNVNMFRTLEYAATSFPLSKPRFVLEGMGLRLVNCPVVTADEIPDVLRGFDRHPLRPHEYWYIPDLYRSHVLDVSRLHAYVRSRVIWRQRSVLVRQALAPGSEALRLVARTARLFCEEARTLGALPKVVVIPSVKDLTALKAGENPWEALDQALSADGVDAVFFLPHVLLEQLLSAEPTSLYVDGVGHLNRSGNETVARLLAGELRKLLGK